MHLLWIYFYKTRKTSQALKNQCNIPITRTQVSKQVLPPTSKSSSNSITQLSPSQNEVQEGDQEAGPGPAT
ncbi:hypothetical protein F8M41_019518 [Gigaspora margarita]|uniref:Uncharacterized protein n=1 Tax=Gigaspora margarita TaxID=4874 RepID=A0A8H4EKC7_GIGMA|nr:hypothetical protein F8M41_019517 [Gigaspora margarita]KAF0504541.1 hypothetical protein F8M41_019518 [Gigaspora margarita]